MNEVTPLQGAIVSAKESSQQADHLAMALEVIRAQTALQQAVAQAPVVQQRGMSAGKVAGIVVGSVMLGGVVVAMLLSAAIVAPALAVSSLVLLKVYREMFGKGQA